MAYGGTKESLRNLEQQGWTLCDGRLIDRNASQFQKLFAAIGTSWGGDGANKFALPDLRGMFLRGISDSTGVDPDAYNRDKSRPELNSSGNGGNAVGSKQKDEIKVHSHVYSDAYYAEVNCGNQGLFGNQGDSDWDNGRCANNQTTATTGGAESRPKNAYVYYIIKL